MTQIDIEKVPVQCRENMNFSTFVDYYNDLLKNGDYKKFEYEGFTCEIKRHPQFQILCGYVNIGHCFVDEINVHGEFTFKEGQKVGFDCSHVNLGDFIPGIVGCNYENSVYRDFAFVENELKSVVNQLFDQEIISITGGK